MLRLTALFCILITYNVNGQGKYTFPYKEFSYVKIYLVDTLQSEEISQKMSTPLNPASLVDIEKQKISNYFTYFKTVEKRTIDRLLKVVNNTTNYYFGDCSTVFIMGGFIFYDSNDSIIAAIEVSPTCYEVFFKPENQDARGQLNKKGEKKLIALLRELRMIK